MKNTNLHKVTIDKIFKPLLLIGLLLINVAFLVSATTSAKTNHFFKGSGSVSGNITNMETGQSLPMANIIIEGTSIGTVSDRNGEFFISNVVPGEYNLVVSMIGYVPESKRIVVKTNENVRVIFKMKETPIEMGSIVVTGTRTPRFIKDIPLRTEVLTCRAIEDKDAGNIYEALDGLPGIRVEQQCQFCNFSMIRMQGLGANHTELLRDGQPIFSGLANVYGLQQISTADIDRIEIVKGAGSALYGSNAIAGAINIISKAPGFYPEARVGIEMGSYNTDRFDFTASIRKNDFAMTLFTWKSKGDAIDETRDGCSIDEVRGRDGISDRVRTENINAGFNIFIDNLLDNDQLVFRGRYINELRQGGELSDNLFENPFTSGTERIITDRYELQSNYSKHFQTGLELNVNLALTNHRRNATNDTFLDDYKRVYGKLPPVDILRPYMATGNLYSLTANVTRSYLLNHRLLVGVQHRLNGLEESGKYLDPQSGEPYTSYSDKNAEEFGVYFQDEYNVTCNLELVAGVRFDLHHSEDIFRGSGNVTPGGVEPARFDNRSISPRFAFKYHITPELTIRGSAGTGHREPYGFSEDLHLCSGSPRVWKGSNLKPEESKSANCSLDYYGNKTSLGINAYYTILQNAIGFVDADEAVSRLGYTYEWRNIDDVVVRGVELSCNAAITGNFGLAIDLAINDGKYNSCREDWRGTKYYKISRYVSRFPATVGGVRIDYERHGWDFMVRGDYTGSMYIDYFQESRDPTKIKKTEPFVTVDMKISKMLKMVKVYAGVKNLTGYIQPERHIDDAAFMYAPLYGRICYCGMNLSLK
ncbi:MAG: TonB-dependent receptor [FCB group bacterium]|nr:TonB-dependent receptor [FCB group bacterium]